MKTAEPIKRDWKWGTSQGGRQLIRLLDQQLTFRQKLEWLEEAETLSLRLRASREAHSSEEPASRSGGQSFGVPRLRGSEGETA